MRCFWVLLVVFLGACAGVRREERFYGKTIREEILESPVFAHSLTGFTLMDAETGKVLCDVNGDKYFTPASTIKILTLYTCLHVLGDSMPGLRAFPAPHRFKFAPTGDPTFLHPKFQAWQPVWAYLKALPPGEIALYDRYRLDPLGPGWAWDDVDFEFSTERGLLPMYGNTKRVFAPVDDSLVIEPSFWQERMAELDFLPEGENSRVWSTRDNAIYYSVWSRFPAGFEKMIPIHNVAEYVEKLLEDTLKRPVTLEAEDWPRVSPKILYSCPVDTVYRRMMYQSDNFLAEQLLFVGAVNRFDEFAGDSTFNVFEQGLLLRWATDSLLTALPQPLKWVDGSGLSRYNLTTPQDLAEVLRRLWREQPRERLFSLFPSVGASDTTLDWYKILPGEKPYIFAKTGSMSGVQCLAGYLVTRQGRVLIFSFMNNNFVAPGKAWKEEMRRVLERVRS